ncbi:MAG: methyltransferase domain-containing protein [Phycisphaerae bacterium]|nr:methyltransferase domain-containing protein [Phycisphaerae bacterium]
MARIPRARPDPRRTFHTDAQVRLNARRLEHLSRCGLVEAGRKVLEVGAGIGDLTSYFTDRGCSIVVTEGRRELVELIRAGQTAIMSRKATVLDLERPPAPRPGEFDLAFCYGVLHLLADPAPALDFMRACLHDQGRILIEMTVSHGDAEVLNPRTLPAVEIDGSLHGRGCRPTRAWMWARLRERFEHVYVPRVQPRHETFPVEWNQGRTDGVQRAVFVAARAPIVNPWLASELLPVQRDAPTGT